MRIKFMDIYNYTLIPKIRLTCAKVPISDRAIKVNPQGNLTHWTKYEWKSPIPIEDRYDYLSNNTFTTEQLQVGICYFRNPLIIETAGAYK